MTSLSQIIDALYLQEIHHSNAIPGDGTLISIQDSASQVAVEVLLQPNLSAWEHVEV
ncbi:hypothetical protein MTO96_042269, partial [Rhipicephalus appendiculatus]